MDPNGGTSTRDIPLQVMDPKLYAQAAMLAPQAMTMATGNAIVTAPFPQGSTNTGATMTYASKSLGIVYRDYLHDHYKSVTCLSPHSCLTSRTCVPPHTRLPTCSHLPAFDHNSC